MSDNKNSNKMKKINLARIILFILLIVFLGSCKKSTDLKVTIYTVDDLIVKDCHVRLYTTEDDWFNDTNPVFSDYTDTDGQVTFFDIEPRLYYIDAYRTGYSGLGYYCNWYLAYKITGIEKGEFNTCEIHVDYYTDKKKTAFNKNIKNNPASMEEKVIENK